MTRRGALRGAAAVATVACQSRDGDQGAVRASAGGADRAPDGATDWGGLDIARVNGMGEDKGGTAVVLLHGWGAHGDDLVPLAKSLSRPGARFFVPAAPLPETGGGRAWWHLDPNDRPVHAWDEQGDANYQPHRQVSDVRSRIQAVLAAIRARYAPETLIVGGFSQGAMLSLDVALAASPAVDRVVVMSGVMLTDSLAGLRAQRTSRPRVFQSHGRRDPLLPFAAAEKAKEMLERHAFAVQWRPFDGGHEIPPVVRSDLTTFLFG